MKLSAFKSNLIACRYWLFLLLGAIIAAALLGGRNTSLIRIIVAIAGACLAVAYGFLRKRHPEFCLTWVLSQKGYVRNAGLGFYLAATVAVSVGTMNYYRFDATQLTKQENYDDVTYYYLNSKFFEELGYKNFYEAILIADAESVHHFKDVTQYRDLATYQMRPTRDAFANKAAVKGRFSKERWEQFRADLTFITQTWRNGNWRYLFSDHGYNPPPTWTLLGGFLSNAVSVENMKWITAIDIVLIAIMFVVTAITFGFDAFIFSILFFVTTLSGVWPVLGQALLRFDWLAASVIAMALFKKERYAGAGACLAYAGLIRIFPLVLFFPFAVSIGTQLISKRTVEPKHIRMLIGAATMSIALLGTSLVKYGTDSFVESKHKMAMHSGPDSYSSHRSGLGDAMVYHGETTRVEMNVRGGTLAKGEEIRARLPYLWGLGIASLLFIAVLMRRTGRPDFTFMPLSIMMLYAVTTPQINYYNIRILLFIWSIYEFKPKRSAVGLVMLFLTEALVHGLDARYERYTATSATSICLAAYFIFVVLSHAEDIFGHLFQEDASGPWTRRPMVRSTARMAGILLLAAIPHFIYRNSENRAFETDSVPYKELSTAKADGSRWDAPSNVIIKRPGGVSVELPSLFHSKHLDISVDGNDTYRVEFYHRGTAVAILSLPKRTVPGKGLSVHRKTIPAPAAHQGFDRITIVPVDGDGNYSIGHLMLSESNRNE